MLNTIEELRAHIVAHRKEISLSYISVHILNKRKDFLRDFAFGKLRKGKRAFTSLVDKEKETFDYFNKNTENGQY